MFNDPKCHMFPSSQPHRHLTAHGAEALTRGVCCDEAHVAAEHPANAAQQEAPLQPLLRNNTDPDIKKAQIK